VAATSKATTTARRVNGAVSTTVRAILTEAVSRYKNPATTTADTTASADPWNGATVMVANPIKNNFASWISSRSAVPNSITARS